MKKSHILSLAHATFEKILGCQQEKMIVLATLFTESSTYLGSLGSAKAEMIVNICSRKAQGPEVTIRAPIYSA
jgi:hypothetical protein